MIFRPTSWDKDPLSAAADWFSGFHDFQSEKFGQKTRRAPLPIDSEVSKRPHFPRHSHLHFSRVMV